MSVFNLPAPTVRLLTLAFGVSLALAVQLAAVSGFVDLLLAGSLPGAAFFSLILMVLFSAGAIIGAFTAMLEPGPSRLASAACSEALAITSAVVASHLAGRMPNAAYFWITLGTHVLFSFAMMTVLMSPLKVGDKWSRYPRLAAPAIVGTSGILGYLSQSWLSLEGIANNMGFIRDITLILVPAATLIALTKVKTLMLEPKNWWESLALRLPMGRDQGPERMTLMLACGGLVASFLINFFGKLALAPESQDTLGAVMSALSLGWFGCIYLSCANLTSLTNEQQNSQLTARLAPTSAKRFLTRYLKDKQNWAATIGLKTTNFVIDHDPGGQLHAALPASILQIRSEEIQRCVNEVLGGINLHSHATTHRVAGAIDPETSVRPCIDALKMFACLYLDAGPLVERRIKGLVSLLPIVDPGLSRLLQPKHVSSLIRRNQWFFHFDFAWLDQHVIHSPRALRYDVRMATLASHIRQSMLAYLEKTDGIGNFVWLGPEARDRLLQEAPGMASVVEPCPIPGGTNDDGPDELLMFIIKFEQLIPRLQRYFDLDTMRRALMDFDPSPESARIHLVLSLQLNNAKTQADLIQLLMQITSVPWRGFREKDNALQLILSAYERLGQFVSPEVALSEAQSDKAKAIHQKLLDAVRAIGYPSQILHHAQISKIALRDIGKLTNVAAHVRDARFQEAWLVIATADYHRYTPEQRQELLAFLQETSKNTPVAVKRLVQSKAVDALASIARVATPGELPRLEATLATTYWWFADRGVDADICCLLLDAHLFVEGHLNRKIDLPAPIKQQFFQHLNVLNDRFGTSHPETTALMSRWQELHTHAAPRLSIVA